MSIFPLGPCRIKFNSKDIGNTLENENTTLSISPLTKEIQTNESTEIKNIIEIGRKITAEASILVSKEVMSTFELDNQLSSLVKKGTLDILTLDGRLNIHFFNCRITIEPKFNFKKSKYNSLKLKITALKDEYGRDLEINIEEV